ncbi:MAG: heparinase [Candidatus Electrothrix sp. AU1_5]|nr:heparinase [Candidatus Electrothrix gigas]
MKRFFRLFYTLWYLQPVQLYGRIWFKLYRPTLDCSGTPTLRTLAGKWATPIQKPVTLLRPWAFSFLNETIECNFPEDWNNNDREKLWLYNLHYFDDLQGLEGEERREWHSRLIEQWIQDNPPPQGNGWEPYPLSLRIVNWIKWALAGNQLADKAGASLAVQARYLSQRIEYHLLGNHLFTNAKALLFAGLFFQGTEAEKWLHRALKIFSQEIPEQILPDGGHFERSPMYHAIILEDMLDIVNIMRVYQKAVPEGWEEKIEEMLSWLKAMCHPDGEIALFNDAALSIAPSPQKIYCYAEALGFRNPPDPSGLTCLKDSGYICYQHKEVSALLDTALIGPDYLPGHAHADTLNFELSLYGQRVIVDSGTSCYGAGQERQRQRGTLAHNTVTVDDQDSSEVWGGFRVARRAKPKNLQVSATEHSIQVICAHDGYRRLPGKVIHTREWIFGQRQMVIRDTLSGKFTKALSRFHFHPDVQCRQPASDIYGEVLLATGNLLKWTVKGGAARFTATTYHPEFGKSLQNSCLEITFFEKKCEVQFTWF